MHIISYKYVITVNVYMEYIGKDVDQQDEDLLKRFDVQYPFWLSPRVN